MVTPYLETDIVKKIRKSLDNINKKIIVMSIKGGVGKSTITSNLALTLASEDHQVGILDADVNNPCVPFIFGVQDKSPVKSASTVFPVTGPLNVKIVSTKFFFPEDSITVIRGGSKTEILRQFLSGITWGKLEYLFIDLPPSIGSEFFSLLQLIPELYGAILVTTPDSLSSKAINRTIKLINQFNINILGIIENMSGFICPNCGEIITPFGEKKGEEIAKKEDIPFLGRIPLIPNLESNFQCGQPIFTIKEYAPIKEQFLKIIKKINK